MLIYLAVDIDGSENIYDEKPIRIGDSWEREFLNGYCRKGYVIPLPKGTIKKLTGVKLKWKDEPISLFVDDDDLGEI
jgi:hypothetical protein